MVQSPTADFSKVTNAAPAEVAKRSKELAEGTPLQQDFSSREVAGGWRLFTRNTIS